MEKNSFVKPRTFLEKLRNIFSAGPAKEHLDELEETLIEADIDLEIITGIVEALKRGKISDYEGAKELLRGIFSDSLRPAAANEPEKKVIILAGINGAGKTTTAAKLAWFFSGKGEKVIFAAADTFRAAAIEQLEAWAKKTGTQIIRGFDGGDPAAVVFDSVKKAKNSLCDRLIIDTAGRLQNKSNLMQELGKIKKVILKEYPEEQIETLLVIDANTGKNAFNQAKEFNEAVKLTGVILTKFDSSAKGGSILRITHELKLPVKYITYGENMEAISEFDPEEFVDKLFV
jgi:fused signal recognition particle receptor